MTQAVAVDRSQFDLRRWLRHHGWSIGVWLLLAVLIIWYASILPKFGAFQITSIAKNSLPLVFLALGQAVIVIAGGIDLSVGALMVLGNATAARLMEGQPFGSTLITGVAIVLGIAALNGLVGWVINVSEVPDIVVTLATSFIFAGFALLMLPSPGGGTSDQFRYIFTGSSSGVGTNFWPPIIVMAIATFAVSQWLTRSKVGLSLYATGSDRNAAFLSGVSVTRAKIIAYAVGGGLAAMAGLATTALTGSGDPRFAIGANATLTSIAAIVLGGIALTGGVGSVVGATAAGVILFTLSPILTAVGIDPNTGQVIRGVIIVLVMMVAGYIETRRRLAK